MGNSSHASLKVESRRRRVDMLTRAIELKLITAEQVPDVLRRATLPTAQKIWESNTSKGKDCDRISAEFFHFEVDLKIHSLLFKDEPMTSQFSGRDLASYVTDTGIEPYATEMPAYIAKKLAEKDAAVAKNKLEGSAQGDEQKLPSLKSGPAPKADNAVLPSPPVLPWEAVMSTPAIASWADEVEQEEADAAKSQTSAHGALGSASAAAKLPAPVSLPVRGAQAEQPAHLVQPPVRPALPRAPTAPSKIALSTSSMEKAAGKVAKSVTPDATSRESRPQPANQHWRASKQVREELWARILGKRPYHENCGPFEIWLPPRATDKFYGKNGQVIKEVTNIAGKVRITSDRIDGATKVTLGPQPDVYVKNDWGFGLQLLVVWQTIEEWIEAAKCLQPTEYAPLDESLIRKRHTSFLALQGNHDEALKAIRVKHNDRKVAREKEAAKKATHAQEAMALVSSQVRSLLDGVQPREKGKILDGYVSSLPEEAAGGLQWSQVFKHVSDIWLESAQNDPEDVPLANAWCWEMNRKWAPRRS